MDFLNFISGLLKDLASWALLDWYLAFRERHHTATFIFECLLLTFLIIFIFSVVGLLVR